MFSQTKRRGRVQTTARPLTRPATAQRRSEERDRASRPVRSRPRRASGFRPVAGRVDVTDRLAFSATGREIYFRSDGSVKRIGDHVANPDLARTLALNFETYLLDDLLVKADRNTEPVGLDSG